jgi:hypothetical protein
LKVLKRIVWLLVVGAALLMASCMTHPWFKSRFPWEEQPDPDKKPVITNSAGERYNPGTPSFVPLIDNCMAEGGSRTYCIDNLPPEEMKKFLDWEKKNRRNRVYTN